VAVPEVEVDAAGLHNIRQNRGILLHPENDGECGEVVDIAGDPSQPDNRDIIKI
jgi:hypothetical protein